MSALWEREGMESPEIQVTESEYNAGYQAGLEAAAKVCRDNIVVIERWRDRKLERILDHELGDFRYEGEVYADAILKLKGCA